MLGFHKMVRRIAFFIMIFMVIAPGDLILHSVFAEVGAEEEASERSELMRAIRVGSGLVQFELEPRDPLPSGMTRAAAHDALMNVATVTHPLHRNATTNEVAAAINGIYGRDALVLAETNTRYQILLAGFEGWVNKSGATGTVTVNGRTIHYQVVANYYPFGNFSRSTSGPASVEDHPKTLDYAEDLIPFSPDREGGLTKSVQDVQSMSYYRNEGGLWVRHLTGNVRSRSTNARFTTGVAPSWSKIDTRYYSYDGIYFYTNPRNIRVNGTGAVNANRPHFNYFQYLSFRSKSNLTAAHLNRGLIEASSMTAQQQKDSKMTNTGQYFITAQNNYGTNALLQFAKAIHESGKGLSSLAQNKNNLFGLRAFDSNPNTSANSYPNVQAAINDHAKGWMSRGYLWPDDWRYAGPHVGHKGSGINVRYATDPYWGEKIAGWAFRIDRATGDKDRGRESIGVLQNTASVRVDNHNGTRLYAANASGFKYFPFLMTANQNNLYRMQTDAMVSSTGDSISQTRTYNRTDAIGFIPKSNIHFMAGNGSSEKPQTVQLSPRSGVTRGSRVKLRAGAGTNHTIIRTLSQGTNVMIIGKSSNGNWTKVRVGTRTGWVSTRLVTLINRTGITKSSANLRRGAGTNHAVIRNVAKGTKVTILGVSKTGNWTRVRVGAQVGWISTQAVKTTTHSGVKVKSKTALRTGNGVNYSSIRTLPKGTKVTILGKSSSGNWTFVRVGKKRGWVNSRSIQ